jgi:hypothetical protein
MRRGEGRRQKTKPPLTRTRLFTHSRLIQCLTQWGLFSGAALYGALLGEIYTHLSCSYTNKKHAYSNDGLFLYIIQMVIMFTTNKPSKKLLFNLHMCWESATCNRLREHPFQRSQDGDLCIPMSWGVISSSRPWILDHTTSAFTESRRSGASMVMSKVSFGLRGFGQRIKALIALKFRVSHSISPLACCTMTGHLTSTLELWRLSSLTGHLPVQG